MDECWSYPVFQEVICLHKQFVRFAWKSGDDVDSEKHIRPAGPVSRFRIHLFAYVIYFGREKLRGVFPAYILQQGIAAALERNVEMRLELGPGSYPIHDFISQKVRLNR